jgi:hypothetical protein
MARLAIHGFWNESAPYVEPRARPLSAVTWFALAAALWTSFAALAIFSPDTLASMWDSVANWALPVQILVGIVTLPWFAGLWISQTDWDLWIRVVAITGIAGVNLFTFWPRPKS